MFEEIEAILRYIEESLETEDLEWEAANVLVNIQERLENL